MTFHHPSPSNLASRCSWVSAGSLHGCWVDSLTQAAASFLMQGSHGAQVYVTSIMFGYFVRRVDKRFQLERSMGLLADEKVDTINRLEQLFAQVGCRDNTRTCIPPLSCTSDHALFMQWDRMCACNRTEQRDDRARDGTVWELNGEWNIE